MDNYTCIYKHGVAHHFDIIHYPDSQKQVKLDLCYFANPKYPVVIKCSIRNWDELEVLLCLVAAFRSEDFIIDRIDFLYFFGLRSDRKFNGGSCNYVKDVLAPILKRLDSQCNWPMRFLQPHGRSMVYLGTDAINRTYYHSMPDEFEHMIKIGGDQSAVNIVSDCTPFMRRDQIMYFNKVRNGSEMSIYLNKEFAETIKSSDLPVLIMDDLCDGGATFIAEAQFLRDTDVIKPDRKLYLFVYHGLFIKGFHKLFDYFDKIYTTDSYQEFPEDLHQPLGILADKLYVIDVWEK